MMMMDQKSLRNRHNKTSSPTNFLQTEHSIFSADQSHIPIEQYQDSYRHSNDTSKQMFLLDTPLGLPDKAYPPTYRREPPQYGPLARVSSQNKN